MMTSSRVMTSRWQPHTWWWWWGRKNTWLWM